MRAPKRGRRIRTGDQTRGMDYCRVWLAKRISARAASNAGSSAARLIPLTRRGAVFPRRAGEDGPSDGLDHRRGGRQKPRAKHVHGRGALARGRLGTAPVGLTGPAETPPAGSVGYWSDGARHAAVVTLSASGRRLFIEYEGEVLHTNVAGYIYGDFE